MHKLIVTAVLSAALAGCSKPPAQHVPPAPPATNAPVLSLESYGPIRFGSKLSDAERQLGIKADPLGENDPA